MIQKNVIGTKDKSTKKDLFNIAPYIEGLSRFVENCDTPMTIAIQGDWGSGKSSMMEMVQQTISKDNIIINLNTWQYSQFKLDDKLPITFFESLIEQLSKDEIGNIFPSINSLLPDLIGGIAILGAGIVAGTNGTELAKNTVNKLTEKTAVQIINKIKLQFTDIVEKRCSNENKNRIIFFIDDLDRLQPEKAVELMEILKIFLDCDKCVFILAIDYGVVSEGVKKKYSGMDDIKARSFFDKIIQVPFTMPVGRYNIKKYIRELLSMSGLMNTFDSLKNNDDKIDDAYIDVVRCTIGCNPRSIKRLINTYALLTNIIGCQVENEVSNEYLSVMFATICCQLSNEKLYNYMLELSSNLDKLKEFYINILTNDESALKDDPVILEKLGLTQASELRLNEIIIYINKLAEIAKLQDDNIDYTNSNENDEVIINDKALKLLSETLRMSATTATSTSPDTSDDYFDAKITYIYDVLKILIEKTNGNSNKLNRKIISTTASEYANERGISQTTIANNYTRLLKCDTQGFYELCDAFLGGDKNKLIEQIIITNKNKKISDDSIRRKFNQL